MRSRRHEDTGLPGWLWFFLALPISMIFLLIWQRKSIREQLDRRAAARARRYVEPDSIPIDTRTGPGLQAESLASTAAEAPLEGEALYDEEDSAAAASAAANTGAYDAGSFGQVTGSAAMRAEDAPAQPEPGQPDDLKLIEGIGPSIAGILKAQGITSFHQLASTPLERLDEILTEANLRRLADPGTWPEQASYAASGDWIALEEFQKSLKAGRRKTG